MFVVQNFSRRILRPLWTWVRRCSTLQKDYWLSVESGCDSSFASASSPDSWKEGADSFVVEFECTLNNRVIVIMLRRRERDRRMMTKRRRN